MSARCVHGDPLLDEAESLRFTDDQVSARRLVALCVSMARFGLIPRGVANPMAMIRNYGATWFQYRGVQNCPQCNSDLRDVEHGPPFKREISVYCRDRDRTVAYRCPDCDHEWPR